MALQVKEGAVYRGVQFLTSKFNEQAGLNVESQSHSTSYPPQQRGDTLNSDPSLKQPGPRRLLRTRHATIAGATVLLAAACGTASTTGGRSESPVGKRSDVVAAEHVASG